MSAPVMLQLRPLTAESFAPYGAVIQASERPPDSMNDGRFARTDDIARISGEHPRISVVKAIQATELPWKIDSVERHEATQCFMPLDSVVFPVVVAAAKEEPGVERLQAFITDGQQGIQYHAGTWHMPLIAFNKGQRFLVIDQGQDQHTEIAQLSQPVFLAGPGITC